MRNESQNNKKVLNEMIDIFYPNNVLKKEKCLDFMGYEFDEFNKPTYHHIKKASALRQEKESDGPTIDNGAILGDLSHQALHYIETFDKPLYDEWNGLFLEINQTRTKFSAAYMPKIIDLQDRSSKAIDEHEAEKSSRNR